MSSELPDVAGGDAKPPGTESRSDSRPNRAAYAWSVLILAALVALEAFVRIHTALIDPNFNEQSSKGLLRSDPGLLYYVTNRIVQSHGWPPSDFRRDPNIEYPEFTDWPAIETASEEFLCAWIAVLVGPTVPLHIVCLWTMGVISAFAVLGAFGMTLELTRSVRLALLAAVLFCVFSVNYRTVGFIIIREDLAIPLYSVHLWLLARAVRLRTTSAIVGSALALGCALASWHATSFIATIELLCVLAWFVRTGENPFSVRHAWLFPATLLLFGATVPALRSNAFVLSPLCLVLTSFALAARLQERRAIARPTRAAATCAFALVVVALGSVVSRMVFAQEGYDHVYELMISKIAYFGARPDEPEKLSFGARLLWSGPFATGTIGDLLFGYPLGMLMIAIGAVLAVPLWWRGDKQRTSEAVLVLFALVAVIVGLLVQRLFILPGLLAPAVAGVVCARVRRRWMGIAILAVGVVAQGAHFASLVNGYVNPWYIPPERGIELTRLVDWIHAHVPQSEPVAADFVNSTALLAQSGNPIVFQPKYENARTRARLRDFYDAFFRGSVDDMRQLLQRLRCRYFLVERWTLWGAMRYTAGIPESQRVPSPNTAAAWFCSSNPNVITNVPHFRLVYHSSNNPRTDMFQLYRME